LHKVVIFIYFIAVSFVGNLVIVHTPQLRPIRYSCV